jgi:hypothetical protein
MINELQKPSRSTDSDNAVGSGDLILPFKPCGFFVSIVAGRRVLLALSA